MTIDLVKIIFTQKNQTENVRPVYEYDMFGSYVSKRICTMCGMITERCLFSLFSALVCRLLPKNERTVRSHSRKRAWVRNSRSVHHLRISKIKISALKLDEFSGIHKHTLYKLCAFLVRMNHNGRNILTGNGDVTHQECTSSPGMGMCLTENLDVTHRECTFSPGMGM